MVREGPLKLQKQLGAEKASDSGTAAKSSTLRRGGKRRIAEDIRHRVEDPLDFTLLERSDAEVQDKANSNSNSMFHSNPFIYIQSAG